MLSKFRRTKQAPVQETAQEPVQEPVQDNNEDYGYRLVDKLTTTSYLVPIGIVGFCLVWFGLRPLFLGALAGGCVVWWFWGKKINARDAKMVLAVDLETAIVAPVAIGRKRWAKAIIVGRPFLQFRTPSGLSVEIVKSYDGETNTVVYPESGEFSDLHIATIPARYGDLIDLLVELSKENMELTTEKELLGIKKARQHNKKLSQLVDDLLTPPRSENGT